MDTDSYARYYKHDGKSRRRDNEVEELAKNIGKRKNYFRKIDFLNQVHIIDQAGHGKF